MSSSPLIPREKLSAYQRWELHSFDLPGAFANSENNPAAAAREDDNTETARRAAYDAGHADGLRTGSARAAADAKQLQELLTSAAQQSRRIGEKLAEDLLGLSLAIARQMIRRTLTVHPEVILPLITDALAEISTASTQPTLTLHPADAALVRSRLPDSLAEGNWQIVEDAAIARGGCLVHTAASHVDATVQGRWQHLLNQLGMNGSWLD
jgi:flagellar assembly protein FliH